MKTRATVVTIAVLLLMLSLANALAACGGTTQPGPSASASPPTATSTFPSTPAGSQLAWVVDRINAGQAVGAAVVAQHFSPAFLAQVPAAQLNAALSKLVAAAPLRLAGVIGASSPTALVTHLVGASGTSLNATITVAPAPPHLIVGLLFRPHAATAVPTDWHQVDAGLRALAGHASLLASEVGGKTPIDSLRPDAPGAIGSAFKLYVLGALASAIEHHSASWNEQLAIHPGWKSLPSGDLRNARDGRRYALRYYAQQMIAVSDNTAADHLIHRLGRSAVEAELARLGMREPLLDTPFLTTRELFALKLSAPAALRDAYASGGAAQRRRLLTRIDTLPVSLAAAASWTAPREVGTIEWFASPADLARAMIALQAAAQRPGRAPIREILARNPGITFSKTRWPYVAFKGGSEPGVLSLTWLLRRSDGRTFVLSIVLNDSTKAIDEASAVGIAEGAVNLLAKAR